MSEILMRLAHYYSHLIEKTSKFCKPVTPNGHAKRTARGGKRLNNELLQKLQRFLSQMGVMRFYLGQMTSKAPMFGQWATQGLERIGNHNAVNVLITRE